MKVKKNNIYNKYRVLKTDILIFLIGTVLAKAIQFFLMPLYTSYMTPEAYGIAELTNNLSELLFPIVTLCIYEAAFRFAVDPNFDNKRLVTAVIKIMGKSLTIGFLAFVFLKYFFNYKYSFFLYFILCSYSIRMCAAYYVRGQGLSKIFAMSGVINALTLGFFNILFLIFFKLSVAGYLLSIGLSYCCSAVYLLFCGKVTNSYIKDIDSTDDLNILLKYCIPLIFYNILYWFTTISGRYILLWYTNPSTAGKYVAAMKLAAVVNMIQQAIYAAFQLNTSRAYTETNKEKYYTNIINLFIKLYCTFGAVVICAIPLIAVITLRNDFYEARIYLPIILLAALINCISSVVGAMYSTYKRTQRMVGVSFVGATINILFGILLTPYYGIWGICVASTLCYFSQMIYKFIDVRCFCEIQYEWKTIIPNFLLLITQVVVSLLAKNYVTHISITIVLILLLINRKCFNAFFSKF